MTQALATLLEHAEHQRDEALARLMQAEDAARRMQAQSEQLRTYRGEYAARSPARTGRAAPIELLRCHLDFMQRLDQALAQQLEMAEHAERQAIEQRQALVAMETRVASVRKLIERRDQAEQRLANRVEQRHADEASQQRAWRLRGEAMQFSL